MVRGFKLEMSEAQHITDVYSEVAAISASDTQELAIAMSKTASSAASVGMSFENTTAMIATMVEATRESATNIGSAMKSIISRMSEMKAGLSQDENGEFLDASKVETALKSVGVALRDTQGQFRDLDQVIIELGSKWSSLDSATKRYLGTIIAGNRQQSRFLALMENYDRFAEIQESAMNAEDASVLQYAKTLDSLESKLNQISNSFQQFYMSILNGPVIGSFLSFLNQVITGFTKLGNFSSLFNIISIIKGVKTLASFLLTTFSDTGSSISIKLKQAFQETISVARDAGRKAKLAYEDGFNGTNLQPNINLSATGGGTTGGKLKNILSNLKQNPSALINLGLNVGGGLLSSAGAAISGNGNSRLGSIFSAGGSALSMASYGLTLGGPKGAVVGGTIGLISQLPAIISSFKNALEESIEKLKKEQEDANIKRVEDKQAASNLQSYIDKYNKLQKAQYDSAEAAQAYVDIQNEIAEKYPQYVSYLTESGDAVVNMSTATQDLSKALDQAAESTQTWADKLVETKEAEVKSAEKNLGLSSRKFDESGLPTLSETEEWFYITKPQQKAQVLQNISGLQYSSAFESSQNTSAYLKKQGITQDSSYKDLIAAVTNLFGVDSLNRLAQQLTALNESDPLTTQFLEGYITDILGNVFEVEDGIYSVSENVNNYLEAVAEYTDGLATSLSTKTYSYSRVYLDTSKNASILKDISGEEAIISQMIKQTGISAKDYKQADYDASADQFTQFWQSYGTDALESYMQDFNKVSKTAMDKALAVARQSNDVAIQATVEAFNASFEENRKSAVDMLTVNAIALGTEYYQTLVAPIINDLSNEQIKDFNSRLVELKTMAEEGGAYGKAQADRQMILLAKYYANLAKLAPDLQVKFLNNFGSSEWATSFSSEEIQELVDAGILSVGDSIDNYIYEQLNTYLNGTSERLADLATAFTSATDKQLGSGFTLKEAKEIVQKFHLDSFDSAFIYDVFQGAYYLTNEAQQAMRNNLNDQVKNIQDYSDRLKKLQVKNYNDFRTQDYADTYSQLTLQQKQAVDQARENAIIDGVIDIDIYNKNLQDLINAGQISINDAMNQLFALNIKDIQTAKQYVNSKDKRTADAAKAYVEEFYDYAANLTGKVTADQVSKLSTYGIDTTLIKVGDEWNKAIEHIGDEQAKSIAKAAQAYSREEMKTKLSSGLQDIFTSIVSGEEVAANDVADLVESALGRSLNSSERDAIERELKESPQLLMEQLKAIITSSLRSQVVDEEEIQKILTELTITVVETISTAIEDGVSLLAKGITDGISQSELKQLSNLFKVSPDQIASYDQSTGKYRTSGEQFISTLTTSPVIKGRDTYAYSRQLTETLGGKGGVLGSYESITKEIERVEKNINNCTDQEKARLKILKEMQAVYANIADSQRFDFMGYDMMQGQMDDFDNWIDSIQQVQDVFQGLSDNDGKMNYKNFLSMIDYIQKFHPDASSLQIAGQSLDQFAVAIMNTVDIAGNVDFSAVADAMTQGVGQMADAMKETLAEVARERIKTLEATKAALVAQLAVQKALESMQLKPEDMQVDWSKQNPVEDWITRITDSGKKAIDAMDNLTEEQKAASKAYLDSFPIGKQILDALGFKPEDMAKWEEDQQNAFNQIMAVFSSKIPDIMSQAAENVQASGISYSDSEQWGKAYYKEFQRLALIGWEAAQSESQTTFEAPNAKIIGDAQIEAPSTTTTTSTEAKDTTKALTDTAAAIDKAEEAFKNFGQTGQEEIGKIKTAITDLVTQLDSLKESFNLGTTETQMEIQLKAVIDEYTNAPGVDPNQQVENLNGTVGSFAPTAEGETSKESLVNNLVATVERFLPAPGVDKNSLVSDLTAIVNLSSDPETLYNNIVAYMSAKKVSVAIQLANDGNEEALANLWKDLNPAEQSLVALNATSETAAKTLKTVASNYTLIGAAAASTGLAVNTSETNNQEKLAGTNDAVNNVSTKYGEVSTAANNASTAIANAESANQDNIKKTGDAAGIAKKRIADMARGEHKIKVNANTKPAIMAANQAVKDIEAKSATVTVTYRSEMTGVEKQNLRIQAGEGMPEPPKKGGLWNTVKSWFGGGKYQGTVNDLGPAYAQGTKTLVGELGPELAVYDNAYHLLGRDGAELVDIPDDAIIFNHKQTEGILKGQANNGRGKTVNGQPAFATGNVSGPAYAGGLSGAIAAIDREIMAWKALLSMTTADLLGSAGGGGGGGSGNTLKAHIEDLVEWYNLTRQIADIEQKINNIIAKRANITDGRAYLKSLREQQHLLEGQALVQKTLLGYQQKQLELQAEQINTHDIWKQFFHVGNDGLLQYNMGNEVNGGKGTLTLLQQLNQMSGAEQLSYIKNLGYSYVTNDGEQLDGEDLISKFFEEAQAQIDKYDELRDTVESTDEALSKLESSINEIEQEIRDNQKELEEIIYNTLVEAWEKQISQLQEQTDMLREANEAYVNGLNDALNKERNQYSQNKSISDRQQLQRQLSLLRRSGGSASQIASLEEQLNSALKEEYFSHQQETIDNIKEANDKQLDALNKQITLQQETLDFQKENGVLWTKVYEVLSQSDGKIMEFLIQNSSEFIQASALAQADMLNEEWAKRIGIYKANSEEGFEPYVQKANQMFATEAWNSAEGPQKQSMFNALDVASQKALQDYFASAFANEMLRNGGDEAAAYEVARQDMYQKLYQAYNQMKNIQNTTLDAIRNISQPNVAPKDNTAGTGGGSSNAGGGTGGNKDSSGSSKKQQLSITYKRLVTTGVSKGRSGGGSPSGPSNLEVGKSGTISWNCNSGFVQGGFEISDTSKCSISGSTITALASGSVTVTLKYWDRNPAPDDAKKKARESAPKTTSTPTSPAPLPSNLSDAVRKKLLKNKKSVLYADSGALVGSDNTPAILHKGEGVFTAGETSALRSMVKNYQTLAANLTGNSLLSAMSSIGSYSFSNTRNAGSELNINPGAVVIHVDKLDDKYDVDELATDVFNKLSTIASKATNRGVNRR